ncbi:hypothetical protein SDC9_91534 [bioreactor metagenome]|uniref:Uncharacterized protein n=1 Tax=bioreactor metagenome TaxID=1076179 RepID=A0A644ZVI8_9ZZZZ
MPPPFQHLLHRRLFFLRFAHEKEGQDQFHRIKIEGGDISKFEYRVNGTIFIQKLDYVRSLVIIDQRKPFQLLARNPV